MVKYLLAALSSLDASLTANDGNNRNSDAPNATE
jgi:hypothetical protein